MWGWEGTPSDVCRGGREHPVVWVGVGEQRMGGDAWARAQTDV